MGRRSFSCAFVFTSLLLPVLCDVYHRNTSAQSNLLQELLSGYGPHTVRPVYNMSKITTVEFELTVVQVIELNEKHQTIQISGWLQQAWEDEFMQWEPSEHGDVRSVHVDRSKIWTPDTTLYKNVDTGFERYKDISLQVNHDGFVSWETPVILKATCKIDVRRFPFDTQVCELRFTCWIFDGTEVALRPKGDSIRANQKHYADDGVWELLEIRLIPNSEKLYPELCYFLHLRRRPLFHVLNILVPCVLLSVLNLMVFALPAECGEKIQLGMANLLALVLFQELISESLPPASDTPPIVAFYFTPMIVIACTSIGCTVFVLNIFYRDSRRPVPRYMSKLVFQMNRIGFYHIRGLPQHKCIHRQNEVDQPLRDRCEELGTPVRNRRTSELTRSGPGADGRGENDQSVEAKDTRDEVMHSVDSCVYCRAYCVHIANNDGSFKTDSLTQRLNNDERVEWMDIALVVDRVAFILSVFITLSAMLITATLFATDN